MDIKTEPHKEKTKQPKEAGIKTTFISTKQSLQASKEEELLKPKKLPAMLENNSSTTSIIPSSPPRTSAKSSSDYLHSMMFSSLEEMSPIKNLIF
ncbi:hypothetical protein CDL12_03431 [Handroanthus impetiginosus]|uniref:Uncharacterized protein n=1 Tax=Handroanthus impetiginosus TaxID=429701 RepID=A0A2G9I261_9LAMI|nr:hypothetical protein CDL12_03431 [Handroanthus impetiginosus]